MARYYDADALDMFINASIRDPKHENIGFNISYLKRCLKEMETTDVVEIVRCKDCKHRIIEPNDDWCECTGCDIDLNGFCSDGERGIDNGKIR